MPSLHTAITVLMAFALWRVRPALGIAGGIYSLAMGFSLIYLGEHYLVDVLAGAVLAVGVAWWVGNRGPGIGIREWRGTALMRTGIRPPPRSPNPESRPR